MNRFIATSVASISLCVSFLADAAQAIGDPAKAQALVSQVCAACHGVDGNSLLPANPSLAGQHADYLYKQLVEFKSGARANAIMTAIAANLSPDDMHNLAAYYSSQAARRTGATDKEAVEQGARLYRGGNASNGTAACAGCHSPDGAGIPAQFPRLANQHPEYVIAQLKAFRAGERANDPNQMMRSTAAKLSDKEIAALAQYVSGLH